VNAYKTCSAIVLALLIGTTGCSPDSPSGDSPHEAVETPHADVFVSSSEITIDIRVPDRETWHWYAADSPDHAIEYEWQIYFGETEAPHYSLGFTLFKHPDAAPATGTFSALVGAGQINLWTVDGGHGRLHETAVDAEVLDHRLRIHLQDAALIEEVFGPRPQTVTLSVRVPGAPEYNSQVPVLYRSM
jgi:hypothetical protein